MVATACLFFACKVEEQPRRLREFIEAIHKTFHKTSEPIDPKSEVNNATQSSECFERKYMHVEIQLFFCY